MLAQWLAWLPHSNKVWGLNPSRFCAWFAWVYSSALHGQKHVGSKLPVGENVSVNGCSSLYVSPVMNWQLGDLREKNKRENLFQRKELERIS